MSTFDNTDGDGNLTLDAQPTYDYTVALEDVAPTITQKIAEQQQPGETWYQTLARALPIIATTAQQAQILRVQMDRASKGLPPLNASQYGVGVQIGLSSETKSMLMIGGAALLAVLFLKK